VAQYMSYDPPLSEVADIVNATLEERNNHIAELERLLRFCYNEDAVRLHYWNPLIEEYYQNWLTDLRRQMQEVPDAE
jgi:hypothetical protein